MITPTPEEQLAEARRLAKVPFNKPEDWVQTVAAALAAAFERGREEEREACLKIAEDACRYADTSEEAIVAGRIVDSIRARKTEGATDA